MGISQRNGAGESAGFVGRESEDHHIRRVAGEILTQEVHAALRVGDRVDGAADIQFAPVISRRSAIGCELDEKLAEILIRAGIRLVTGPEAIFVELDLLPLHAAKDHRPEPTVPNRQSLRLPILRWFVVEKLQVGRHGERSGSKEGSKEQ